MTVVPVMETLSEHAKVEAWRLKTLLDAGYPIPLAERLAANPRVDLHQAVELVKPTRPGRKPCPPEQAAAILA